MGVNPQLLNTVGLLFNLSGAIFLGRGLIISSKKAVELSVSRYAGNTIEENIQLPQVHDRLSQSRNAKIGIGLLVIGFLIQLVGSLLS